MSLVINKADKIDFLVDKSDILSGPLHMSLDVTNKCNARCLHCFNRSGNELPRAELTDEELLNVFHQIAEVKPFSICFCGGEPMIKYDLLVEGAKILKKAGVSSIGMVSNGWYITKEKVNALEQAGLNHLQISIDGVDAKTHERMRGVEGIFDRAINALEIINESGLTLAVAFSPTRFNIHQFPEVVKMLSKYKKLVQIRMQPLMPMGKALAGDDMLFPTEDDYRNVVKFIEDYNRNRNIKLEPEIEWGDPLDHLRRFSTLNFKKSLFSEIKSDGSISISTYLPLRVGNIKKHTLKEYWDAGLGKSWQIPVVRELADNVSSIGDMRQDGEDMPTNFFEDNIEFDIIDDKVFDNLESYSLKKLYKPSNQL